MAFCTRCGKAVGDQAAFCTSCGAPHQAAESAKQPNNDSAPEPGGGTRPAQLTCASCGMAIAAGNTFCTRCGTPVPPSPNSAQSDSLVSVASGTTEPESPTPVAADSPEAETPPPAAGLEAPAATVGLSPADSDIVEDLADNEPDVAGGAHAVAPTVPLGVGAAAGVMHGTAPTDSAICGHCGSPLEPDAAFCIDCGAVNTPATPLPPSEPQGVDQLGHGKPRRPVLIAAAIVAAIVVVAAGVWFGLQQFGTDSDDSNEAAATTTSPTSSTSPDEATTTTSTSTPSTDEGASGGSVTTATTTATTVPESTTTTPTVTTVAPPTTSAQRFSYVGGRYPSVAEGEFAYSGCTPGPADLLPDGVWYGFAPTWSTIDIVFDLACVSYTFDASCSCDVPTVTNNNTLLRTLPLAPTAAAYGASDGYQTGPMTVTEFTADPGSDADAYRYLAGLELVISVNDGLVTEIAIPIRP